MSIERLKFRGKTNCDIQLSINPDGPMAARGDWIIASTLIQIRDFWYLIERGDIDPATVGQFTGAKDESNDDIYEDDIGLYKVRFSDEEGVKYVVFYDGAKLSWRLKELNGSGIREFDLGSANWHFKTIGTIHDKEDK